MNRFDYYCSIVKEMSQKPHPVYSDELIRVRDFLFNELKNIGYQVRLDDVLLPDGLGQNIVAVKPSNGFKKVVVLGAHYDSVPSAPGAKDNASGVAAMLCIAKNLFNQNIPQNIELRIVLFTAEEIGAYGSKAYAKKLHENNECAYAIISDVFAPDKDIPCALVCQTPGEGESLIVNSFNDALAQKNLKDDETRESRFWSHRVYGHSDHESFMHEGYQSANITIRGNRANNAKLFNGYHSEQDFFKKELFDETIILESLEILFLTVCNLMNKIGE